MLLKDKYKEIKNYLFYYGNWKLLFRLIIAMEKLLSHYHW